MTNNSVQPAKPRYFWGAFVGGCVAALVSAIGMMLLMLDGQVSAFSMSGFPGGESIVFAPQNLLLSAVFFMSALPVWFLGFSVIGRAMLGYSISSGRLSLGSWMGIIVLIGVGAAIALNLNTEHGAVFSGPFLPAALILSATLGFVVFWKKADSANLQLKSKLRRQGLTGKKNEPAEWAVAAARRIADNKD